MNQIASTQLVGVRMWPLKTSLIDPNGNGSLTAVFDALRSLSAGPRLEVALLKAQRCLDQLVHHDHLTGMPNRLFLNACLPQILEQAARGRRTLALVFLDLDRFKHVNASWGHTAGDQLLRGVAQRICAAAGSDDLVVRMGNDEFVIVLPGVENDSQLEAATRHLLDTLRAPFDVEGRPLVISASAGASLYPRDGASVCELLRHASMALSHARARGRNSLQRYSPIMSRELDQQACLEARLQRAIQERTLQVHYQPIVDVQSRRIVALESLARWKDPGEDPVSPEVFIRVAEEGGLIVPLGELVLDRVLQDIVQWRRSGCEAVPVALNVSAMQLRCSDFPERLLAKAHAAGVSPRMLHVELTESVAFERAEGCGGELLEDPVARLRALGAHISIDDFGTRYACLSYLKRWRVDSVKIDRAFVNELATDSSDVAIVAGICDMARRLGISIIAEGVEGPRQLMKLRELGCPLAQGYLFSKPVPAEECFHFLLGKPLE